MTIIGLYDFRLLDTEKPMIGVYLFDTDQHLGTIVKVPYELGWTIAPGFGFEEQIFQDEITAADALREAWETSHETKVPEED